MTASAAPSPRGPDAYIVVLYTTKGATGLHAVREWAPLASDRFYAMTQARILSNSRFFRVIRNDTARTRFVAQWGIPGNPTLTAEWLDNTLPNEAPRSSGAGFVSNTRGTVAFGAEYNEDKSETCCRSIEVYVNYDDNSRLDPLGFAPFAVAVPVPPAALANPAAMAEWADAALAAGLPDTDPGSINAAMAPFDALYAGYGEDFSWESLYAEGNEYTDRELPMLDHLLHTEIVATTAPTSPASPTTTMPRPERTASTAVFVVFSLAVVAGAAWAAYSKYVGRGVAHSSLDRVHSSLDGVHSPLDRAHSSLDRV